MASDLEVWTVPLTLSPLGLFQRGKGFRFPEQNPLIPEREEQSNHALKMTCNRRGDSEKGTALSSVAGWCVFMGQEALCDVGGTSSGRSC